MSGAHRAYDARNSNLTMGFQILELNAYVKELLGNPLDLSTIYALQSTINWMDGLLQNYRSIMKAEFYDPYKDKVILWPNYSSGIKEVWRSLKELDDEIMEDKFLGRAKYVFYLNRYYELLSSCYKKLQLLPPERMTEANKGLLDEEKQEEESEGLPGTQAGEETEEGQGYGHYPTQ